MKPGKGHGLLVAIGLGGPKKSMKHDEEDDMEHDEGGEEHPGPDETEHDDEAVGMALDDVADALDLDGDKREEFKDSLRRLCEAVWESKESTEGEEPGEEE